MATTTPFFITIIVECHERRRQTLVKQASKEKKVSFLIWENSVGFNWDKVPGSHLSDPPAIALQVWHLLTSILRIPFICSCLPNRRTLTGQTRSSLMIRNTWVLPKPRTFRAGCHWGLSDLLSSSSQFSQKDISPGIWDHHSCKLHLFQKDTFLPPS